MNGSIASGTNMSSALATLKTGQYAKIDTQLAALYTNNAATAAHSFAQSSDPVAGILAGVRSFTNSVTVGSDGRTYVVIDATASDGNGADLLAHLNSLGLQQGSSYGSLASGLLPIDAIGQLSSLANLGTARESAMGSSAGLVTSQADVALHTDYARTTYDVDGSGLKIGVLSDSFNTSNSTAPDGSPDNLATNIASGDLPANTVVLRDFAGGSDEGRAMAQLIHDIAPGAAIEFATAFTGQAGFANNIERLAADGAKVITDDVAYYFEPAYQDGVIAQAVDKVAAQGVSYFSSAGNNGVEGYESHFYSAGYDDRFGGRMLEFAPGQTALSFVASGYDDVFILQWDEPSASAGGKGSRSDLDFFLTDASGNTVYTMSAANNKGGDPSEGFDFQGVAGQTYYLRVSLYDGPAPNFVKIMALGNGSGVDLGTTERNLNTGTVYGHAAAVGANAIGAAYYLETPAYGTNPALLEYYSSGGPTRIAFDDLGNRLPNVEVRNAPVFTAVDGTNTTFFGSDTRGDADNFPNFFGTSAAAPNAAAVALLMLQANPNLTNTDITALLKSSALDMDNPATPGFDHGYDVGSGSGLIQGDLAVRFAATGIIENPNAVDLFGTHLNDTIIGNAGDNVITGGAGDDSIQGGLGNDTIDGGAGNDVIGGGRGNDLLTGGLGNDKISGGLGNDVLRGIDGDDRMNGDAGNDQLFGGGGNDTLIGGAGSDRMTGGSGADSFRFLVGDGDHKSNDVITDFLSGTDKLDLTGIHDAGGRYSILSNTAGHADVGIDGNGDGISDYTIHITLTGNFLQTGDILFA